MQDCKVNAASEQVRTLVPSSKMGRNKKGRRKPARESLDLNSG